MSHLYEQSMKLTSAHKAEQYEKDRTRARELRTEGLSFATIAARLSCGEARVRALLTTNRKWMEPKERGA